MSLSSTIKQATEDEPLAVLLTAGVLTLFSILCLFVTINGLVDTHLENSARIEVARIEAGAEIETARLQAEAAKDVARTVAKAFE